MDLFWVDESRNITKTYSNLLDDLNDKDTIRKYIYMDNPYGIVLELIHSLIIGYNVELIDSDFSETELSNLGICIQSINEEEKVEKLKLKSFKELIDKIYSKSNQWRLSLYTSGTTGRPKKVTHTFNSIKRSVKEDEKYKKNIWSFSYNPTHFAGLQVFFQAFLNKNPMIYIFDSDKDRICELLIKYKVTNISATPTFYRMLMPYLKEKVFTVKRITLGGEKFDKTLMASFVNVFPNAQVRNIYASTEAGSLFTSTNEIFTVEENLKSHIKISEDGELLIHKDLLGLSSDYKIDDGWYHTGDVVEINEDNKIKFLSRKTEMINIGGYKVNPHEVEDEIKKIKGVIDVVVKARSNKITGNILIAEVVKSSKYTEEEIEEKILKELSKELQRWKIPRMIRFVNDINKTRSGKKVRK